MVWSDTPSAPIFRRRWYPGSYILHQKGSFHETWKTGNLYPRTGDRFIDPVYPVLVTFLRFTWMVDIQTYAFAV